MSQATLFLFLYKSKYRRKWPSLLWTNLLELSVIFSLLISPTRTIEQDPTADCQVNCINGDCIVTTTAEKEIDHRCDCWPGWTGPRCDLCGRKMKLSAGGPRRWIAEALGNYTTNMKCTWLVVADHPNSTIRLHLNEFATECGWDHLYIWDGDSIFEGLQAVYSGLVRHERYSTSRVPEVVGTSGSMLLHFYSDVAYNMTGFNITFSMDSCPTEYAATTCSGHGTCDEELTTCACDKDYKGIACEIPACPQNCGRTGKCAEEEKRCECSPGWRGEECNQQEEKGVWEVLDSGAFSREERRTSHQAVVIGSEMWIVGGEQLHKQTDHNMLRKWSFESKSWADVEVVGLHAPSERYGHSVVLHDNKIYMYGGTMRSGHVSKELWSFDLLLRNWTIEPVNRGRCLGDICGEIHCSGHTATLVENRMMVMFGHSPKYGFLDTVQEYHFGSQEWNVIETNGYPVKGGYGHSAVFDKSTKKIFVYGGYISTSSTASQLTNSLYAFDIHASRWELRKSSYSHRYLHSAVSVDGLMLVYGGNTHNDTQFSQGAKCYSADFIAYDIACDRWYSLENTVPRDFSGDLPRFGHSAVLYGSSMYVYGGFNGQTKSDILVFSPGSCAHIKDPLECVSSRVGVKCVWNRKKEVCEVYSSGAQRSIQEMCNNNNYNHTVECNLETSCHSCLATSDQCVWCSDGCQPDKCPLRKDVKATSRLGDCLGSGAKEVCENMHTCDGCTAISRCKWNSDKQGSEKFCREKSVQSGSNESEESGVGRKDPPGTCPVSCSERTNCENCTNGLCMWCHNQQMCIDRNAYLVSFPYGQCMDWTTSRDQCFEAESSNATVVPNLCHGYQTCSDCLSNPACGWCDEGSVTGLGRCYEGGARGPLTRNPTKVKNQWSWEPSTVCKDFRNGWHFTSCPSCQCNGHSNCSQPGVCDQPCLHRTQGKHCERCTEGYYGNPVNGGGCVKCECNDQGSLCDHKTGNCFCNTKGVTGDHCEKCDTQNHYFGDPIKDSCFYDLAIDYQFTFNLSKSEDRYYTAINFKNIPTKADVDVDFSITCSVPSKMNLTYRHGGKDGAQKKEDIISEKNCSVFKFRFSKGDYTFGSEENTTFYVYVYDFQTPLWITLSFSQHPKLDLLQFFITFSVCFLALLVIAAILWKIKQKYDRYRRRQRLYVEMEQMASRPFGSVLVELERIPDTAESAHNQARKRRKKSRPSPIALEPCAGNRAAILSLIVRLPTGGNSYSPHGVPGVAVASSLVTLGNPRKPSTDQTPKVETEPKTRKARKVNSNTSATDL